MLLNNGEYSEAVLRFEGLAAYKDSCKLRIKALAHIDLRNAVISFYQNFSDAVSMAAKDIKYSQKVYTLLADCDLREEVLISRTGNLFVRFAIGTIVDVDGISYEVGLQYSLDGHTYVKAAGGTFIKCDKNIAGVDKGDNYVEELDTSCYYYEEVISS